MLLQYVQFSVTFSYNMTIDKSWLVQLRRIYELSIQFPGKNSKTPKDFFIPSGFKSVVPV